MVPTEEEKKLLLFEYQCSQQSGHHQDALLWNTVSIFVAAIVVLLGFTLNVLKEQSTQVLVWLIAVLGALLTFGVGIFIWVRHGVMKINYEICQEIEVALNLPKHAHSRITEWYPRCIQRTVIYLILAGLLYTWIAILYGPK